MDKACPDAQRSAFRQLLEQLRAGSQEAWSKLVAIFTPQLQQLARQSLPKKLRPKVPDSDLVQETLLVAFQEVESFRGSTEPEMGQWLGSILVHKVEDAMRKFYATAKRDVRREVPLAEGQRESCLPVDTRTPERTAEEKEEAADFEWAMHQLPDGERQALELHYYEDLSYRQIGEKLHLGEEAARALCLRAQRHLKSFLETVRAMRWGKRRRPPPGEKR